jgi:hypothetical protein
MDKFAEGVEKRMKILEDVVTTEAWKVANKPAEEEEKVATVEVEGYGPDDEEMEGFTLSGLQKLAARGVVVSVHVDELPPPPEPEEEAEDQAEGELPTFEPTPKQKRVGDMDVSERSTMSQHFST